MQEQTEMTKNTSTIFLTCLLKIVLNNFIANYKNKSQVATTFKFYRPIKYAKNMLFSFSFAWIGHI